MVQTALEPRAIRALMKPHIEAILALMENIRRSYKADQPLTKDDITLIKYILEEAKALNAIKKHISDEYGADMYARFHVDGSLDAFEDCYGLLKGAWKTAKEATDFLDCVRLGNEAATIADKLVKKGIISSPKWITK